MTQEPTGCDMFGCGIPETGQDIGRDARFPFDRSIRLRMPIFDKCVHRHKLRYSHICSNKCSICCVPLHHQHCMDKNCPLFAGVCFQPPKKPIVPLSSLLLVSSLYLVSLSCCKQPFFVHRSRANKLSLAYSTTEEEWFQMSSFTTQLRISNKTKAHAVFVCARARAHAKFGRTKKCCVFFGK